MRNVSKVKDMEWIAHSENDIGKVQRLAEHLIGVGQRSADYTQGYRPSGVSELAKLVGFYHDVGKYDERVQQRLRGLLKHRVEHSGAGARILFDEFATHPTVAYLLSLLVMSHHSGLVDFQRWRQRVRSNTSTAKKNIEVEPPGIVENSEITGLLTRTDIFNPGKDSLEICLLIRMLFSALVDADFLDTEEHFQAEKAKQRANLHLREITASANFGEYTPRSNVDQLRTEMSETVLKQAELPIGLYDLSIPTGGGKTRTALKFAFHHAKANGLQRVIVAIPFTSIIEQTVEEYRKWLGYDAVLEHHHLADYKEQSGDEDSEYGIAHKLASENWDMPVVVTTHVQFFESLFGHRTSVCRKLHNIANSVVIIDEAQMIPVKYLPLIAPLLKMLRDDYNVSFVICTATQPPLSYYGVGTIHLITDPEKYQEALLRATIEPRFMTHQDTISSLVDEIRKYKKSLIICNKKSTVEKLYREARQRGLDVLVLTTNLYPTHRMRVIRQIQDRLQRKEGCIVIATQLVEAGVDLDFPVVFRELAPLDRVIQAAGRANRNGMLLPQLGQCVVFELDGERPLQDEELATGITRGLFHKYHDDIRRQSPSVCQIYYEKLYLQQSVQYTSAEREIWQAMKAWNHPRVSRLTRFIEEDDMVAAVPFEALDETEKGTVQSIIEEVRHTGYVSKDQRRILGRYVVQVRDVSRINPLTAGANIGIWRGDYHKTLGVLQ